MASFLCFKFRDGITPANLVIHVIPGVPFSPWVPPTGRTCGPAEGSVPRTYPGDGRASAAALPPRLRPSSHLDPLLSSRGSFGNTHFWSTSPLRCFLFPLDFRFGMAQSSLLPWFWHPKNWQSGHVVLCLDVNIGTCWAYLVFRMLKFQGQHPKAGWQFPAREIHWHRCGRLGITFGGLRTSSKDKVLDWPSTNKRPPSFLRILRKPRSTAALFSSASCPWWTLKDELYGL